MKENNNNNSSESDKTMVSPESEVCVFKKPNKSNQRNMRKRTMDNENNNENEDHVEIVRRQKTDQKGMNVAATAKSLKLETHAFSSSDNVGAKIDQFATSTYDIDGPTSDPNHPKASVSNIDGIYRGMAGYGDFIEKKESMQIKGLKGIKAGPVKQAANLHATSRMDYQPDLCKDYKETGYCGFGDACKFMHDRGDYKSGWQLERDWEEEQKAKQEARLTGINKLNSENLQVKEGEAEDDLPFACFICRQPFTHPVVTKCGHYFDEDCALAHNKKSKKCYICNEPTGGIFNTPKRLVEKLAKSKTVIQNKDKEENKEEIE